MNVTAPILRADPHRQIVHSLLPYGDTGEEAEDSIYAHLSSSQWQGGRVVESLVLSPDKVSRMGVQGARQGWWVGIQLSPEQWREYERGEWNAISLEVEEEL